MTDQHPLHPKLIDALSEHKTCEESMRAAADWQLEQVIQAWKQCMLSPSDDTQAIIDFDQKLKAMRPTTQEDN
jgi:hypothetical protein